jgi:hypothetical protein
MFAVGNADLGPFFREIDDLSRRVEAARVAILAEALARGVVAGSECPSATSWVIQWGPSLRAGGAARLVAVAQASLAVRNLALAAAVLGARVGVGNAAVVLVEMDKLRSRLADEALEAVWGTPKAARSWRRSSGPCPRPNPPPACPGPAQPRPAPRRGPDLDLPPGGRRRRRGPDHHQGIPVRHHRPGRPAGPLRGRVRHADRPTPGTGDDPADRV